MAQCPAGSSARGGAPTNFYVAQVPFTQWMALFAPEIVLLVDLVLPPEIINTASFCAAEPPDPGPAPTAADYALIPFQIGKLAQITEYWRNSYKQYLWSQYCQCNSSPPPAGAYDSRISAMVPFVWWPMHDAVGGTTVVESVRADNGSLNGGAVKGVAGIIPGSSGTGISFNGANSNMDWAIVAGLDLKPTSKWTWEFWFKCTNVTLGQHLIDHYPTLNTKPFVDVLISGSQVGVQIGNFGAPGTGNNSIFGGALVNNTSYMVDVTFDGPNGVITIYLNAASVGVINQSWTMDMLPDAGHWRFADAYIGGDVGFFGGTMESVAMFSRLLTPAEISDNFAAGGGTQVVFNPVVPPGSGLPTVPAAMCTSINDVCTRLNQIEALIRNLSVVGIPTAPVSVTNSLAEGTIHAGLSGAGEITLTNALGIKVSLTTIPASLFVFGGDPVVYFDAGFVTPITPEAPLRGDRVLFANQLYFLPQATTKIGYSFGAGVVATITEITRGP